MSLTPYACAVALLTCSAALGQTSRRAVLIDIDGVRRDTFTKIYREGRLPNFQRIFDRALWYDNASTVLPTVTMAAQASIFTGVTPAKHGIVGNQWYDRDQGKVIEYLNTRGIVCVYGSTWLDGSGCAGGLANGHLQSPTVYEAAGAAGLNSMVIYSQYWKGASQPAPPSVLEELTFVSGTAVEYKAFDTGMAARAVQELKARGLPSILTLYFAGADGVAHELGIAGQTAYLSEVIDPLLGKILDAIDGLDAGWRNSTMIVLTSDHGRTDAAAHAEDRLLMADLAAALPKGAVIAENGGTAYVYLERPREELIALAATVASDFRLAQAVASVRLRNGEESARAGDLIVTLLPGHYFGNTGVGSHHGSVYSDDLMVPLLVAGPDIAGGHVSEAVRVTQVVGTIARYVGFGMETSDAALPLEAGRSMRRVGVRE